MGSLTIRNMDDSIKAKLRMVAAMNDRSMEEEARQILKKFLLEQRCSEGIGSRIANRFANAGGVILPEIQRSQPRFSADAQLDEEK